MTKPRVLWIVFALLLTAAVAFALVKNNDSKPAEAPAASTPAALEFLQSDVVRVEPGELRQNLSLSGSLRAVNQASVKARVGGEVREVLVREGEAVKAGQVLARMDTSEYQARVDQARGALLAARGQLNIAAQARDNNKALVAKGFISKNAFDNAQSQYDIAQANVDSARGALAVAQKSLDDTVIRAPISGLVSSRTVQPGEKVSPDNRLLDVVDLRKMEMEASVPTSEIVNVELDQDVLVRVEGLPAPLAGKVTRINPATQAGSRSILVYVQVDNPEGMLRAGMFGEAQLTLSKKTDVLAVPQTAIQNSAGSTTVYAIENGKLVQKPVTLGQVGSNEDGSAVEIVSGLQAGALVVRSNMGTLRTGTPVKFAQTQAQTPRPSTPAAASADGS